MPSRPVLVDEGPRNPEAERSDVKLENGQRFPEITAPLVGGGGITVPKDLGGRWGVLVFYRGHW